MSVLAARGRGGTRSTSRSRRGGRLLDPRAGGARRRARHGARRNAIHAALCLVGAMLSLGVFYVVEQAPFLGAVQIIVYTGAIMILFLFVLMLVGRDSSDSLVETLRGQRVAAIVLGIGFAGLLVAGIGHATAAPAATGLDGAHNARRQRPGHRRAAVHPLRLRLRGHQRAAHHRGGRRDGAGAPRARAGPATQRELSRARFRDRPPAAAARAGRLRPRQLGGRPGAAARRQRLRGDPGTGLRDAAGRRLAGGTGRGQLGRPDEALRHPRPEPRNGAEADR